MSLTVFLDAGPLGLITNPKRTQNSIAATQWAVDILTAGNRIVVPAIADYEVRRELIRARKTNGLRALDDWNMARPGRYLPLTDSALRLGAELWAEARMAGTSTADPKELDGDVLIAAQALDTGLSPAAFVIATVNVSHLRLFAPAELWTNVTP
jgi:predicted nucleic acid-binding protein